MDQEKIIQSLDEKLASAKKKNKNLSDMCSKLQSENNRFAKLPYLISNLKPFYQKQRKCMLGHHRRTSSSQYNSSILGHDDLSRIMAEFDIHFKELEKEASSFQSCKENASHAKENELEV